MSKNYRFALNPFHPSSEYSSDGCTPPSELEDAFIDEEVLQQQLLLDAFSVTTEKLQVSSFEGSDNDRNVDTPEDVSSLSFDKVNDYVDLQPEILVSPQNCIVTGNALYCGSVGKVMSFTVNTARAGEGCLSVTLRGPTPESVLETTVRLLHRNMYRVSYRVCQEGYFIINVRWADWQVPGSPFLCRVSP